MNLTRVLTVLIVVLVAVDAGFNVRCRQIKAEETAYMKSVFKNDTAASKLASAGDVDLQPASTLMTVKRNLESYYVEKITDTDEDKMTHEAIKYMTASFNDPYTRYLDKEEYAAVENASNGIFDGIGAVLTLDQKKIGKDETEESLVIMSVLPGSPAAKAGLKPGDAVTEIDGRSVLPFNPFRYANKLVNDARNHRGDRKEIIKKLEAEQKRVEKGKTMFESQKILNKKSEKPLTLTVKTGDKTRKVKIETAHMKLSPVTVNGSVIKVNYLGEKTGDAFDKAMESVKGSSLTLDLTDIGGGDIDAAKQIASHFIPNKILTVISLANSKEETVKVPTGKAYNGKVTVKVNGGTAGTAEILANSLRQNAKVTVEGTKTYGDPTMTMLFENYDKTGYILKAGEMKMPTKVNIAGKGATIDREVK
ncbi:MAG: PDZ domain-containing protein [Abditibacteriota bacterium]|nr:PDZ domain-containing protein [Abditibacteriota bacterium]